VRDRFSDRDRGPEALLTEVLAIIEINADERIVATVVFDPDDIDAAHAELDARYLAGEAAAHSHTWSVIAGIQAAVNRRELPATTPDPGYIDHRPLVSIEGVDLAASIRAVLDIHSAYSVYVEAVHRLDELGAVYTQVHNGTSHDGVDAEWRIIEVQTVEGDLLSHVEVFDEADLEAALARFDGLHLQLKRLENAASEAERRFGVCFAARDWDAMAQLLSDDTLMDDRRHVVNAGVRHGRDAEIASQRAIADVGVTNYTSTVIAVRGARLALGCYSVLDGWSGTKVLGISEINAENQIVARVVFDADDIVAAFEELDARYLAGEAAAHAHTWSVIARAYAALNRHELPSTTTDSVYIDHRPVVRIDALGLAASLGAMWDLAPDVSGYIEAVHRLSEFRAVVTQLIKGTTHEGFDAEWPTIGIYTVEGDLISGCEVFGEADIDAALARFEELHPQARRLQNTASRVMERFAAKFAARDWDAIGEILADDCLTDDRRRVVGVGIRQGREVNVADSRAIADIGTKNVTVTVIATRGERLALVRLAFVGRDQRTEAFRTELLGVVEINAEHQIATHRMFDLEDTDDAIAELDARYLAGDGAAHAHTWSVIMQVCAALNRREIFATTADFVDIDHRSLAPIQSGHLKAYMREALNDGLYNVYIEAVHRLSGLGAVITLVSNGTSQEGFDGEWRMADIFTAEGNLISRCEIFDEADLDAAVARFEELQPHAPRLENAATQLIERHVAHFAARDWVALAEDLADNVATEDRRRVVNAGNMHGREADIANMRALADLGIANIASTIIATRGERLALNRARMTGRDQRPEAFYTEALSVTEVDADNRLAAQVVFDPDDIDAAFEELDARYLAGEAAPHAHTWSVIAAFYAGYNRHELPATTPDTVYIDHRPLMWIEGVDLAASLRAVWDLMEVNVYIEAVHRLSELGAVVTTVLRGTSHEGLDAELRMIAVFTVEGDLLSRAEVFDEADLDAALAAFDELN
jgi:hypothetical protein